MGKKGSLARQLLALQLLIVLVLLAAVAAVVVAQVSETFRNTESRRMLGIAEDVAANPSLRVLLGDPKQHLRLAPFAAAAQVASGADVVAIARADGKVLTSQDPAEISRPLRLAGSTVTDGRAWVGEIDGSVIAHVPVIAQEQHRLVGYVAAQKKQPAMWQILVESFPGLLSLLGIASAVGVAGSLSVAWWLKRQTFGLEPAEITGLVEHREAMLHGIREGVVGLDQQQRITLVNDQAKALLTLGDVVGRSVYELGLNERILDVFTGKAEGADLIGLRRGKVLVMNRTPIRWDQHTLGAVVTLRDRTELVRLQDQLTENRNTADTLRAQAHEFSNRLHTIAGLIELGEYDEVHRYVDRVSANRDQWQARVTSKVGDPAVAALLIAKASLAAEQGVGLRLAESSELGEVDTALSADIVTVLGNLVDNALDALPGPGTSTGWIEVDLRQSDAAVHVVVRDSGPGVAPEIAQEVFRHGFTTKAAEEGGQRGLGLAITRQACVRRGGVVSVHNAEGAVFTATLPMVPEGRG
ncbi:sensor histidine kinase [Nocardia iowensis]|uniref:Spo0B domain-containing protein n=1 Tax=Nocardia iowensis TaxID=204891 RepID=A0ABX8RKR0_NOCIO|nr:ATP-binding protein [Nocardia iowensis]QXN89509.1 Spo0B domain-containing protein [Nocardia iowensis]